MIPILYSFRRCPYAIRARVALHYAGQQVELREVILKHKPEQMLAASAKATVPILVLDDRVIDESVEIMQWALQMNDPSGWLCGSDGSLVEHELVKQNDFEFKPILDRYKYFERSPEQSQDAYLQQAVPFLEQLTALIIENNGFLAGRSFSGVDAAVFPFIRQFAHADLAKFNDLGLPELRMWLNWCLDSTFFSNVMNKYSAWSQEEDNSVKFG